MRILDGSLGSFRSSRNLWADGRSGTVTGLVTIEVFWMAAKVTFEKSLVGTVDVTVEFSMLVVTSTEGWPEPFIQTEVVLGSLSFPGWTCRAYRPLLWRDWR